MDNKCKCKICGKEVTNNNSYIGSHVKRVHNLPMNDYVEKYYKLTNEFKLEQCGFCEKDAIPNYIIDNTSCTYIKNYDNGYFCGEEECRNKISLEILGIPYEKTKYERIGSKSEYLSKLHKTDLDTAKKMKYGDRIILDEYKTNLTGFILRHGDIEGLKKYKERCEKIGKSNSKEWYTDKFGDDIGVDKWNSYISKIKKNTLGTRVSKSSKKIDTLLREIKINFETEYTIPNTYKFVDFYLYDLNIVIEYFGDYWHMNPRLYEKEFFNKTLKVTSEEVWEKDRKRNLEILEKIKDCTLIIIWETTKIDSTYLLKLINEIKNKKTIVYL